MDAQDRSRSRRLAHRGREPSDAKTLVRSRLALALFGAIASLSLGVWAGVLAVRDGSIGYYAATLLAIMVCVIAVVNAVIIVRRWTDSRTFVDRDTD